MGTRVLLADDHAIVRQGLRILLEHGGFEIVGGLREISPRSVIPTGVAVLEMEQEERS